MLPFGYNPQNYGGKVWWNENNPEICAIWGTQADYDRYIQQGGTWEEYESLVKLRMTALGKQNEERLSQQLSMENNSSIYTLNDIKKFITDYKASQERKPKEWMAGISVIGRKMYQKSYLENSKIEFFELVYDKARIGSIEEQIEFINQMTPILDDFYSGKEKHNVKKR